MKELIRNFTEAFGTAPQRFFSAPGRTELGGNHTDHQGGRVLAAAVGPDIRAAVRPNGTGLIRVQSEGYPLFQVEVAQTQPVPGEEGTTAALIRGMVAELQALGCPVEGFDACCASRVLPGSGLSSSAAFEVLLGTVINTLFNEGRCTPAQIALAGQRAENRYFGKPCGLMDQMASALGGPVAMDFEDPDHPRVQSVDFDFSTCSHSLCIIHTGGSHADLTQEYAAIPGELRTVSQAFGKERLAQVPEQAFYDALPHLRQACGDRAVLRAIHVYEENRRVDRQVQALSAGDFDAFLTQVRESGRSSWMYLQNLIPGGETRHQPLALALALCDRLLAGTGACRIHGGGFAGTVQAYVPPDRLEHFKAGIDAVFGPGSCQVMPLRSRGSGELFP